MEIRKGVVLQTEEDKEIICVALDGNVAVFAVYVEDYWPKIDFTKTYVYDVKRLEYGPITEITSYEKDGSFSLLKDK